jgi:hypothetical protein
MEITSVEEPIENDKKIYVISIIILTNYYLLVSFLSSSRSISGWFIHLQPPLGPIFTLTSQGNSLVSSPHFLVWREEVILPAWM